MTIPTTAKLDRLVLPPEPDYSVRGFCIYEYNSHEKRRAEARRCTKLNNSGQFLVELLDRDLNFSHDILG